MAFYLKMCW